MPKFLAQLGQSVNINDPLHFHHETPEKFAGARERANSSSCLVVHVALNLYKINIWVWDVFSLIVIQSYFSFMKVVVISSSCQWCPIDKSNMVYNQQGCALVSAQIYSREVGIVIASFMEAFY